MIQIPVKQASDELDKLLDRVAHGQELVIISSDGTAFKLLPLSRIPQPIFGSARGLVAIGPDFEELLKVLKSICRETVARYTYFLVVYCWR